MHLPCGVVPARFIKNEKQQQLNSLYGQAAKLILPDRSFSTSAKSKALEILSLQAQFMYNTAVLMFKVRMGLTPEYVCNLLN